MHEENKWGGGGKGWAGEVRKWARELDASTILDYGCGRGTLKTNIEGMIVHEYDPGVVGKDREPLPADMVVSTDVLEHIEPALLRNVLTHMRGLARLGSFHNIALSKAKLVMPDGRNAHLSLLTADAWLTLFGSVGFVVMRHEARKGLVIWTK